MTYITMTKDQLVDRLREQRPVAEAYDAKMLAEHKVDEKVALAKFRDACRTAAKWTYEEAKEHDFSLTSLLEIPGRYSRNFGPTCPMSKVREIDLALTELGYTNQKTFTIEPRGKHHTLHHLVTWNPDAPTGGMC